MENEQITDFLQIVIKTSSQAASQNYSVEWANIVIRAKRFLHYLQNSSCKFPFTYVPGIVSKALEVGDWLLIDEINLAPTECFDSIIQIVDSSKNIHSNFRFFACMNPATDVGKHFLPISVRSRFTEFFVHEPTEKDQLEIIVKKYLPCIDLSNFNQIFNFYQQIQTTFPKKYRFFIIYSF